MLTNLKVNTNNFKKKIIYTTTILVIGSTFLSGCSVVNNEETYKENYELEITLNLSNYETLNIPDLLIVYDDNNNIYNAADGDSEIKIIEVTPERLDNLNISSEALDTVLDLPVIDDSETYEVNIDYINKTYGVEVIKKEQEKGISR